MHPNSSLRSLRKLGRAGVLPLTLSLSSVCAARALIVMVLFIVFGDVYAAAPMQKSSGSAWHRQMLGAFEITALLDTNSPWPSALADLFPQLSKTQIAALQCKTGLRLPVEFSSNVFLVNTGKKLILFDAGAGKNPQEEFSGKLLENLRAAGYRPEQIDDIYLTHFHMDHVGGLSDEGRRVFVNATIHADKNEFSQWQTRANNAEASAQKVMAKLAPYISAGRSQSFAGASELLPGLRSESAYGHTQGHTFYALKSQGQKLLLIGDFLLLDKVQLSLLDLAPPSEPDAAAGIALHKQFYADAANTGLLLGGAHLAFPGLGRIHRGDGAYRWIAADYVRLP